MSGEQSWRRNASGWIVLLLAIGVGTIRASDARAAEWGQFRGPHGRSVAQTSASLPLEWNTASRENVAWRVPVEGRGVSGPIVVGDRVIVTSSSGVKQERLHVICYDTRDGQERWHRQFWATGRTMTHETSANAAPTPASDGQSVYAFFSSNDLICLDLDGNLRWYRGLAYDFPKAGNDVGMSSSPAVADGVVVVQVENQGDSFAAGIDAAQGTTLWRVNRSKEANWSSPVIAQQGDRHYVAVLKSSDGVEAFDLHTGKKQWTFDGDAGGIPSIAVLPDQLVLPTNGLTTIDIRQADVTPAVVWSQNRVNASSASPVVSDSHVYAINGGGVVGCADLKTGEMLWQVRLKGKFWATPVLVDEYLFCINDEGVAQVVKVGAQGEIVATSELGEPVLGSPAVSDDALFVRSTNALWKISQAK